MSEEKLVPKLRFEFSSTWESKKLKDIIQISKEKYNPDSDKINYKCIELEHLSQETGLLLGYTDSINQNSIKNKFHEDNILFGKLRPYLKKFYYTDFVGVCSSEIWVFDTNEYSKYIYYLIQTKRFLDIANVSSGSKMPRSDWNFMKDFVFSIPDIKTQKETANLFFMIDNKIELLEKKYHCYQDFKKYLMQNIFAQKLRFDNTSVIQKEIYLGDVISIINKRNKDNEKLPVLSISNKFGFISQNKQFEDREVASSDKKNYKIVNNGEFAYNPARINVGSIAQLKNFDKGIISPMYIVFKIDSNKLDPIFFENFLNSDYFRHEMLKRLEGSVRMILSAESLKNIKLTVPSIEEQRKMSELFLAFDKKIDITKHQLDNMFEFKKGLLQQMFV